MLEENTPLSSDLLMTEATINDIEKTYRYSDFLARLINSYKRAIVRIDLDAQGMRCALGTPHDYKRREIIETLRRHAEEFLAEHRRDIDCPPPDYCPICGAHLGELP